MAKVKCRDDTLERRLLSKTTKTNTCWLWGGATVGRGYGMIGTGKGNRLVHRVAHKLYIGPVPDDVMVLHTCDNPACLNPKHLFLGNNADNMRDMMAKGRGNKPHGERIALSKLTDSLVRTIRKSILSNRELANICEVNICTIQRARSLQTWRHI